LDAYKDRGTTSAYETHEVQYMRSIANIIDRHMGKSTDSSTTKSPKVPEPKAYSSERMPKSLKGWLKNLLKWYCINRYCNMEHIEDRISSMQSLVLTR